MAYGGLSSLRACGISLVSAMAVALRTIDSHVPNSRLDGKHSSYVHRLEAARARTLF